MRIKIKKKPNWKVATGRKNRNVLGEVFPSKKLATIAKLQMIKGAAITGKTPAAALRTIKEYSKLKIIKTK